MWQHNWTNHFSADWIARGGRRDASAFHAQLSRNDGYEGFDAWSKSVSGIFQ
jgi:hypothetical protein